MRFLHYQWSFPICATPDAHHLLMVSHDAPRCFNKSGVEKSLKCLPLLLFKCGNVVQL